MNSFISKAAMFGLLASSVAISGSPAKALMGTQSTAGQTFSTLGTAPATSPPSFNFSRFDPSLVPANRINIVLRGYEYEVKLGSISGTLSTLGNLTGSPISVGANALVNFKPLTPLVGADVNVGPFSATFSGGANPVPPGVVLNTLNASGPASGISSMQLLPIASVPNFTTPPATPLANLSSYFTNWTITPSNPLLFTNGGAALAVSGSVNVNWLYDYDLIPSASTPGPLPILGAAGALGWSRRMRKRIASKA